MDAFFSPHGSKIWVGEGDVVWLPQRARNLIFANASHILCAMTSVAGRVAAPPVAVNGADGGGGVLGPTDTQISEGRDNGGDGNGSGGSRFGGSEGLPVGVAVGAAAEMVLFVAGAAAGGVWVDERGSGGSSPPHPHWRKTRITCTPPPPRLRLLRPPYQTLRL